MTTFCTCGAAVEIEKAGKCRRCYSRDRKAAARRAAGKAQRKPRTVRQGPSDWMNRYLDRGAPVRRVELDALLSGWRRANPGSIVHVGQHGIALHVFGSEPLRFATVDDAIEFLTRPKIGQAC